MADPRVKPEDDACGEGVVLAPASQPVILAPTSPPPSTPPPLLRHPRPHLSSVILALEARICGGGDNARSRVRQILGSSPRMTPAERESSSPPPLPPPSSPSLSTRRPRRPLHLASSPTPPPPSSPTSPPSSSPLRRGSAAAATTPGAGGRQILGSSPRMTLRRGSRPRPSLSTRHPRPHLSPRRPRPPHPTSSSPTPPHVIRAHLSSVILALEARICSGSDNARSRREADPRSSPRMTPAERGVVLAPASQPVILAPTSPPAVLAPSSPPPSSPLRRGSARGARAPLAGQGRASNDAQRTSMDKDISLYLAKLAGAAAGAMISLVYLMPKGRREALSRFFIELARGLVFGGAAGAALAERFELAGEISRPEILLAGSAAASLAPGGCSARFRASPRNSAAGENARSTTRLNEDEVRDHASERKPFARQTKFAGLDAGDSRRRRLLLGLCQPLRRRRSRPRRRRARRLRRIAREARRGAACGCSSSTTRPSPSAHGRSMREDDRGLYVEGRLATGVARAREVPRPDEGRRPRRAVDRLSQAVQREHRRRRPGCATSSRPISGRSRSSPFRCCRARASPTSSASGAGAGGGRTRRGSPAAIRACTPQESSTHRRG